MVDDSPLRNTLRLDQERGFDEATLARYQHDPAFNYLVNSIRQGIESGELDGATVIAMVALFERVASIFRLSDLRSAVDLVTAEAITHLSADDLARLGELRESDVPPQEIVRFVFDKARRARDE